MRHARSTTFRTCVGAHDPLVIDADIHKELVEGDILLGVSADQIVELQAGDRQHRRPIHLGVVEAIQEVNASRPGGRQTYPEFARVLGIAAGHEGGCFFVPHVDEANLVLMGT